MENKQIILSDKQKAAIECMDNRVVVVAPAGSSKTLVLTEHIRYLIEQGENPKNIYAITFTNLAAQEMMERIDAPVFIGTIHSLANKILLQNNISTYQYIEDEAFDQLLEIAKRQFIDVPLIEHLLVDEFQDVSSDEADFILNTLRPKKFFIVNDPQQAIYSFKGGDVRHAMRLIRDKRTTLHTLNTNYRCGANIINYAERFLKNMEGIHRVKNIPWKDDPGVVEEVNYSLEDIAAYVGENENYRDWFVLTRTNAESNTIIEYLRRQKIPVTTFKKAGKTTEDIKQEVQSNKVKVLTIHSGKGLESPNALVVGLKTFNDEEKRICYVACTRAENRLIVMKGPRNRGKRAKTRPIDDTIDFSTMGSMSRNIRETLDTKHDGWF